MGKKYHHLTQREYGTMQHRVRVKFVDLPLKLREAHNAVQWEKGGRHGEFLFERDEVHLLFDDRKQGGWVGTLGALGKKTPIVELSLETYAARGYSEEEWDCIVGVLAEFLEARRPEREDRPRGGSRKAGTLSGGRSKSRSSGKPREKRLYQGEVVEVVTWGPKTCTVFYPEEGEEGKAPTSELVEFWEVPEETPAPVDGYVEEVSEQVVEMPAVPKWDPMYGFDSRCRSLLTRSQTLAESRHHHRVGFEHLLAEILADPAGLVFLEERVGAGLDTREEFLRAWGPEGEPGYSAPEDAEWEYAVRDCLDAARPAFPEFSETSLEGFLEMFLERAGGFVAEYLGTGVRA